MIESERKSVIESEIERERKRETKRERYDIGEIDFEELLG